MSARSAEQPRRQGAPSQGGPPADHRPGPLCRRHLAARDAVGGVRPLARGAREDRLDRRLGGQGAPRRPRRVSPSEDLTDLAGPLPMAWVPPGIRSTTPSTGRSPRATVKHVGDPVAVVIGEDRYAVVDAAEDVVVEYDPLPVVTDPEEALEAEPHLLHPRPRQQPDLTSGRSAAAISRPASREADVIVERRVVNHRTAGAPIEPRGVLADYRAGQLTVWTATQVPHFVRLFLALLLGMSEEQRARDRARGRRRIRREAPDVLARRSCAHGPRASSAGR